MDSFGLLMFIPLLQFVIGNAENPGDGLGGMSFIIDGFSYLGLPLTLGSVLLVMTALFSLKAILKFSQAYYTTLVRLFFIRSIRFKMTDKLTNLSYKHFVTEDAGKVQNTMSAEVGRVSSAYTAYFSTIENWVFLVVYFSMALITNTQFSILVGIGGLVSNVVYRQIYKRTKENSLKISRGGHEFQRLIIEKVAFFKYLKATGLIKLYNKKLKKAIVYIEEANRKIGFFNAILGASREPLVLIVIAIVIYIQSIFIEGNANGIIPSLIFFYRAIQYVISLQNSWNAFLTSSGALTNLTEFITELEEEQEVYGNSIYEYFQNQIEVRDLTFSFGKKKVLENINLTITKNTTVAFVGESGSGKTTMVNLLCGLMPVNEGLILIDDVPYKDLDIRTFQKRIGYITQDPVIFSDSIYNNISLWAPKTPENLGRFWKACERASISNFIKGLDQKEDALLGNNGVQVSGGQKQRISIARELYKDIEILVMDEATSALDSEVEKSIQENIDSLKGKYTIIIIAHRLSTIKNSDRIFLLKEGKIFTKGSFDELNEGSKEFKRMIALQELN